MKTGMSKGPENGETAAIVVYALPLQPNLQLPLPPPLPPPPPPTSRPPPPPPAFSATAPASRRPAPSPHPPLRPPPARAPPRGRPVRAAAAAGRQADWPLASPVKPNRGRGEARPPPPLRVLRACQSGCSARRLGGRLPGSGGSMLGCALLKVLLREPLTCLELETAWVVAKRRPEWVNGAVGPGFRTRPSRRSCSGCYYQPVGLEVFSDAPFPLASEVLGRVGPRTTVWGTGYLVEQFTL
nr:uncharacterized protein LOC127490783 [Oryctolagus cuniculus]